MSTSKLISRGRNLLLLFVSLLFFLLLTQTAQANHFRSGSMSWERVGGEANTVLIKVEVGWTNDHSHIPTGTAVGEVVTNKLTLNFGDGETHNAALRVTSRNSDSNDVQTELVTIKEGEEEYTAGVEHTYDSAGDYVAYWGSSARESAENQDGSAWQNETKINVGGDYAGNNSPVSAVASVVQVPDDQIFNFDLTAVDKDGDNVEFRYGTEDEFYNNGVNTTATKPTGLQLGSDGSVTWDVRDSELSTAIGDRWQMTVMAEDLDSEGSVKSYVPLDFVLLISDSSDEPPTITTEENSYAVDVGDSVDFSLVGVDPDWGAGKDSPTMSVVNPPSADSNIWSTTQSSSNGTTTMDVSFTPDADMNGDSYVVVFQATDDAGNATTKNVSVNVNLDETAPSSSNISTEAGSVSATTTWSTDEAGSSKVVYGPTNSYGTTTTESNTNPRVTSHSVALTNLTSCTTYHYAVVSTDIVGNTATSSDNTFTTGGCSGDGNPTYATSTLMQANAGGETSSGGEGTIITVGAPANFTATSSSVVIQIHTLDGSDTRDSLGNPSGVSGVGDTVFDVKAIINEVTILDSFDAPVTITYEYADEDVTGFDESSLSLYHYHNGSWQELDDCSVNTNNNSITCSTDSFSVFALFGTPASDDSDSSGIVSGGVLFGCKDEDATNYNRFSSHKQELCEYETDSDQTNNLASVIAKLKAKLAELVAQYEELTGIKYTQANTVSDTTPPSSSADLNSPVRDLEIGIEGEDVRQLQTLLIGQGYAIPAGATGYFGLQTQSALDAYQVDNNIAPRGGYFGPLTREQMMNAKLDGLWW